MKLRLVAHVYLRYTWGCLSAGPGRRTAVVRRPSLSPPARFLPLPWRPRLAPGGRQVPLVSSAWDTATRNAATAVVNSGGSTPPAPPAPRPVTSQVIVAVARNAPSGCPALEVV